MENKKLVSVVITTYNNLKYIFQCIDSVLIQDYPLVELVISDNHSEYFPEADIRSYIEENNNGNIKNVIINRNESNLGLVKNLNRAIKLSTGEYIVHNYGDDVLFSDDVISSIINFYKDNKDFMVAVGNIVHFDEDMINIRGYFPYENFEHISASALDCYKTLCKVGSFFPSPGLSYKRELLDKYGYYDERYRTLDDLPRFLYLTRSGCRIGYINKFLVKHRLGGISSNPKKTPDRSSYEEDLNLVKIREIDPYIDQFK